MPFSIPSALLIGLYAGNLQIQPIYHWKDELLNATHRNIQTITCTEMCRFESLIKPRLCEFESDGANRL